ncbi:MAG: hypothetical protein ACFUZC_23405 [Chthoniobacteraceae bacterium]
MKHSHLCKFAQVIMDAEERRAALQKALAEAEADLDAAFTELFEHYVKNPHPIRFPEDEMNKVSRICSVWVSHSRRGRSTLSKACPAESVKGTSGNRGMSAMKDF